MNEDNLYNEFIDSLSVRQKQLLKHGYASIKEWNDGEFEFVLECEPSDGENSQKKIRNNAAQVAAMHKKQKAARRKKNKMKK